MQKADALRVMEQTKGGRRVPFHLMVVTASRDSWRKKQRLLQELQQLKKGTSQYDALKKSIDEIDVGGRLLEHESCLLSGERGMHSKKAQDKTSENYDVKHAKNPNHWRNRTRNIVFSPSANIRKIHNSLIMEINHIPVTY